MAGANATLTAAEQRDLDKLLAKANAGAVHTPALRLGEPYLALVNLSVPRRGEPVRNAAGQPDVPQTDLVHAGETVYLTADEAARFNRHDPDRDGRRIPVVRKLGTVGEDGLIAGRVHPSLMSGPTFRPGPLPPGGTGPRADPPGSSRVIETSPVPESSAPGVGDENGKLTDALDIPPGGGARQAAAAGADMDIVAAAKSAMGRK
jgi:hypothetical protein